MAQIILEVSDASVEHFKQCIEAETGHKVTDALGLLKEQLEVEAATFFEAFAYMVAEDGESINDSKFIDHNGA